MSEAEFTVEYNGVTYTARRKWENAYWVLELYDENGMQVLRLCTVDEPEDWQEFVERAACLANSTHLT